MHGDWRLDTKRCIHLHAPGAKRDFGTGFTSAGGTPSPWHSKHVSSGYNGYNYNYNVFIDSNGDSDDNLSHQDRANRRVSTTVCDLSQPWPPRSRSKSPGSMALCLADGPRHGITVASILTLLSPPRHFGFCHRRCGFRSGCRQCPEARRAASMTPLLVGLASAGRPTVALCCSACALCVQPVVSGDCLESAQRLRTKPTAALASCLLAHQLPCSRHAHMHNAITMRENA